MKGLVTLVLASQIALVAAFGQSNTPADNGAAVNPSPTVSTPVAGTQQDPNIRILTPSANEKLANTNVVDVRFEVINPASSAGTPNFLIQLDAQDAIRTTSMEQTFTGLAPGPHVVTVQMVDANNTPLSGSRATVQFQVQPQSNGTSPAGTQSPSGTPSSGAAQQELQGGPKDPGVAPQEPLPSASTLLPLISVIGFGVLVGGIASAMKTR